MSTVACLLMLVLVRPVPAAGQGGSPLLLERDSVRVVYWPGQRELAERTLGAAFAPLPLPGIPEARVDPTGTIVLAPTEEQFRTLVRSVPEWSAGVAIPSRRLIILPAYRSQRTGFGDPAVTLRHELAHLALNAYLPGRIPRWFDEGYATWVSGGWDASTAWQIRLALLRGQAPPLDSLTLAWPEGQERARLAYLLSASAVQHLATRAGEGAFAAFLRAWRQQGSLDAALRSTYLMTPEQFENEWRGVVRRRYGWLLGLSSIGAFWIAVVVLLLVFGVRRRRRDRERLREMEREEYMLPPGPPVLDLDDDPPPS